MTTWADVEPIIEGWEELFKAVANYEFSKLKRCRTCVHRKRYAFDHSFRIVQYCELKPSKHHSASGFKTIKVTDIACYYYEERKKK